MTTVPRTQIVCLALAILLASTSLCLAGGSTGPNPANDLVPLAGIRADRIAVLGDDESLAAFSYAERRVVLLNLSSPMPTRQVSFDEFTPKGKVTDFAIVPGAGRLYVVGVDDRANCVLVSLDLGSLAKEMVHFDTPMVHPTLAVSASEIIAIGDVNSSAVILVDGMRLNNRGAATGSMPQFARSIFLKAGPVIDVGISTDGNIVVASHDRSGEVSLVDATSAEVIDTVEPSISGAAGVPIAIVVAEVPPDRRAEAHLSLIQGDLFNDVLKLSDLDARYRRLVTLGRAKLGVDSPMGVQIMRAERDLRPPLIISTSADQRAIIVGHRYGNRVFTFSRINNALERGNAITLNERPLDLSVSRSGHVLAVLSSDGATVKVIKDPVGLLTTVPSAAPQLGAERVREAQRALARLQYPVAVIDGIDGPDTRRLVGMFQKDNGLEPTGTVDDQTLTKMREAASLVPEGGKGARAKAFNR